MLLLLCKLFFGGSYDPGGSENHGGIKSPGGGRGGTSGPKTIIILYFFDFISEIADDDVTDIENHMIPC